MLNKARQSINNASAKILPIIKQLRDVRVVGLLVFALVALLVTWSSVGVIQNNYELQQRIARLQQENDLRQLENENLRLRNQYYETDHYLELQARRQFNRAAPGETLLLVPEETALEYAPNLPNQDTEEMPLSTPAKPVYQENFEAWMEFFFRRDLVDQ
ncbi:MAG: septum formation initiator family protein [Candidatus Saccharibacteria bacterium]|nr:septum formation initiator family protein [Candidatus Saccharibacteria bacterium]